MNVSADENQDLLAAWALDAVDEVERARIERAIARDPELAARARTFRDAVERLADADAQPAPAELRDLVLAEIGQTAQLRPTTDAASPAEDSQRQRPGRGRWLAAVAAVVLAIAIPVGVAIDQAERADQAEHQVELLDEALRQPDAEVVSEDLADGGRAVAVIGSELVVFSASGVPELPDGDYQLWIVDGDVATSAGVLTWQEGRLFTQVGELGPEAALAMTAEPEGGSDQPTTEPLVVLGGA